MKKLLAILALFFLLLSSCLNEDDNRFDENEANPISVEAFILHIGDSSSTRYKADTLYPSDSLIFLAVIEPSRSIRITDYYWQIDSNKVFSEFTYRALLKEPGKHRVRFVLLDRFADTLSDSVTLWIAPNPVLDTDSYIPLSGTKSVDPESELHFAWNAVTDNPLAKLFYHFTLKSPDSLYIDTILERSQFSYSAKLPGLQKITWRVATYDNFGRNAKDSITSVFYTKGTAKKSGITATIAVSNSQALNGFSFSLLDSSGALLDTTKITHSLNGDQFHLSEIDPGPYRIFFYNTQYTDYKSDTVSFYSKTGEVSDLGEIQFQDNIPLQITCNSCISDSLEWRDSLFFNISDNGLSISSSSISLTFDGNTATGWNFKNGKLSVPTQAFIPSFIWHPLKIKASDRAGNYTENLFYVSPGKFCVKTLSDTTLSDTFSIRIPIKNICPELTPKRFFWDVDEDGNWEGESAAEGSDSTSKIFSSALFPNTEETVKAIILYESGISLSASFKLSIKDSE